MVITYESELIRQLSTESYGAHIESILTSTQIEDARAIIADLKASNSLKDVPVGFETIGKEHITEVTITFNGVLLRFKVLTRFPTREPSKIKRLKIIEILRIDLQSNSSNAVFTEKS